MTSSIGTSMYLNLPVDDIAASRAFWSSAGVSFSETYSNDDCVALNFSDHVIVMLLQKDFYRSFLAGREIADTRSTSGCLICLDAASKGDVETFVDAAIAAGGREVLPADPNPAQEMIDAGLMHGRTFTDLDGHTWEILWMSDQMPAG